MALTKDFFELPLAPSPGGSYHSQQTTLVHELLHIVLGEASHAAIADAFNIPYLKGATQEATDKAASWMIDKWIAGDCGPQTDLLP